MKHGILMLTAAAGLFAGAASIDPAPAAAQQTTGFDLPARPYFVDPADLPFAALPGATASWGVTPNGSGWRLEMPDNWNGDLVVQTTAGVQFPAEAMCDGSVKANCRLPAPWLPAIRQHLIAKGFAWVSPTYRDARIDAKSRVMDILDIVDRFRKEHPDRKVRVFPYGMSIGGMTAVHAVELFPQEFSGAVAGCFGDYTGFVDFWQPTLAALGLVAQTDPVIAAFVKDMTWPLDLKRLEQLGPRLYAGLGTNFPWVRNENGEKLRQIVKNLSGGERPLADAGLDNIAGELIPGYVIRMVSVDSGALSFVDNAATEYRWETRPGQPLSVAEQKVNQTVPRFTCDAQVCTSKPLVKGQKKNLGGVHRLSANLQVPVIRLHATGELMAYYSTAQNYAARAAAAGGTKNLVERVIREKAHCGFNEKEQVEAFDDLVKWADTGQRAAGEDILDAARNASPDLGCTFTRGQHSQDWFYEKMCRRQATALK